MNLRVQYFFNDIARGTCFALSLLEAVAAKGGRIYDLGLVATVLKGAITQGSLGSDGYVKDVAAVTKGFARALTTREYITGYNFVKEPEAISLIRYSKGDKTHFVCFNDGQIYDPAPGYIIENGLVKDQVRMPLWRSL